MFYSKMGHIYIPNWALLFCLSCQHDGWGKVMELSSTSRQCHCTHPQRDQRMRSPPRSLHPGARPVQEQVDSCSQTGSDWHRPAQTGTSWYPLPPPRSLRMEQDTTCGSAQAHESLAPNRIWRLAHTNSGNVHATWYGIVLLTFG